MPDPLLISIEEAARLLGVGRDVVYRKVKSGEWESVLLGKRQRKIPLKWLHETFGLPASASPAEEASHA